MRKKAYIHIGVPKTGTTAIQTTLLDFFNRGKLDRFDMQFHHADTWRLIRDFRCTEDREYFIEQIHKNIQKYSKIGKKNIIISNELFTFKWYNGNYIFNYDLLPLLATAFKDYDTKVIIYMRRQDLFLESYVYQLVKGGLCTPCRNEHLYYKELIDQCSEHFGEVIVRKYERESLYKSDAVSDFLHTVGLDELIDDYVANKGKTVNSSFSPQAFRIATVYSKQFLFSETELKPKIEEVKNRYKDGLIKRGEYTCFLHTYLEGQEPGKSLNSLAAQNNLLLNTPNLPPRNSSQGFLSPEDRTAILSKYAEDNAAVAREYFGSEDGVLFNDKVPKNIIDINIEPSVADVIQTFMPIMIELSHRCDNLERRLRFFSFAYYKRNIKRIARKIWIFRK